VQRGKTGINTMHDAAVKEDVKLRSARREQVHKRMVEEGLQPTTLANNAVKVPDIADLTMELPKLPV
jgi:hypothetical protein